MKKIFSSAKSLFDRIPFVGYSGNSRMFLIVDVKGRVILEDCELIKTFTDRLLIVTQGDLLVTITGNNLKLKNMSNHSGEVSGKVENIKIEHTSMRNFGD